jgi:hypothetical protein
MKLQTRIQNLYINLRFTYKGRKTTIHLQQPERGIELVAFVKRAVDDVDDKLLGRKNAFKKAMNQLRANNLITKEECGALWLAFRAEVYQPGEVRTQLINNKKQVVVDKAEYNQLIAAQEREVVHV